MANRSRGREREGSENMEGLGSGYRLSEGRILGCLLMIEWLHGDSNGQGGCMVDKAGQRE